MPARQVRLYKCPVRDTVVEVLEPCGVELVCCGPEMIALGERMCGPRDPHALLGLRTRVDLLRHPKVGASWEGFIIEQVSAAMRLEPADAYFWATHSGAELDMFIERGRRRIGVEVKRTVSPRVTPAMRIAREDLRLTDLFVIHAGARSFDLAKGIRAVACRRLSEEMAPPGRGA